MANPMRDRHSSGADELKNLLQSDAQALLPALRERTRVVTDFVEALGLNTLRKRALRSARLAPPAAKVRVAVMGGCDLRPLVDLMEHFTWVLGELDVQLHVGEYDNYVAEILDQDQVLKDFRPDVVFLLPAER